MKEIQTIPVIEQFLQLWKEKATIYYNQTIERYREIEKEYNNIIDEYNRRWKLPEDQRKELEKDHDKKWEAVKTFRNENNSVISIIWGYPKDEQNERIEKALTREINNKRIKLIARIEKKAGAILDASNLSIGVNGEINGTIIGDIKTVTIETIYAGGYNIQCLHYRVLIK